MFASTCQYIYTTHTLQILTPWYSFQISSQGLLHVLFSHEGHLCLLQKYVIIIIITILLVAFTVLLYGLVQ